MNGFVEREDYSDVDTIDHEDRPAPHHFQRASALMLEPDPVEIVEGVLTADAVTLLVAESGSGKTFLALDMAGAISHGVPWHGRHVMRGSVVYLYFEGGGMGRRLRALASRAGREVEHLHTRKCHEPFSPRLTREGEMRTPGELVICTELVALAGELAQLREPPIVAVMIDTVRASMTGDDGSSQDSANYLRAARRILATVPGAALMLVHHAGWQDGEAAKKRERGSSNWRASSDITLYLEAGSYDRQSFTRPLSLKTLKARDGEPLPPLALLSRRVDLLESDTHGQPITSCIIERDGRTPAEVEAEHEATAAREREEQQFIDQTVLRMVAQRPDLNSSVQKMAGSAGVRKDTVQRAVDRLIAAGFVLAPAKQRQPYALTDAGRAQL